MLLELLNHHNGLLSNILEYISGPEMRQDGVHFGALD